MLPRQAYIATQDSIPGKTDAVAGAVGDMGDQMQTAAGKAKALQTALDNLLGPELSLSEANDAWITGATSPERRPVQDSEDHRGNSDAAIENRAAIRDRIQAMSDSLVAEAKAGAGSAELSSKLQAQRQALIDAGAAAGISRKDLQAISTRSGLTRSWLRRSCGTTPRPQNKGREDYSDELTSIPRYINTSVHTTYTHRVTSSTPVWDAPATPTADSSVALVDPATTRSRHGCRTVSSSSTLPPPAATSDCSTS